MTLVGDAEALAIEGIRKYPDDKNMYRSYFEVGVSALRLSGNWEIYDRAHARAKEAEARVLDPDLRRIIGTYEGLAERINRGVRAKP